MNYEEDINAEASGRGIQTIFFQSRNQTETRKTKTGPA